MCQAFLDGLVLTGAVRRAGGLPFERGTPLDQQGLVRRAGHSAAPRCSGAGRGEAGQPVQPVGPREPWLFPGGTPPGRGEALGDAPLGVHSGEMGVSAGCRRSELLHRRRRHLRQQGWEGRGPYEDAVHGSVVIVPPAEPGMPVAEPAVADPSQRVRHRHQQGVGDGPLPEEPAGGGRELRRIGGVCPSPNHGPAWRAAGPRRIRISAGGRFRPVTAGQLRKQARRSPAGSVRPSARPLRRN